MVDYSVEVCKVSDQDFAACQVDRPLMHNRYDSGAIPTCNIEPISPVLSPCLVRATLRKERGIINSEDESVIAVSSGLALCALLAILSYSLSPYLLYEASVFLSWTV